MKPSKTARKAAQRIEALIHTRGYSASKGAWVIQREINRAGKS